MSIKKLAMVMARVTLATMTVAAAMPAAAIVIGGSNLGVLGYPEPDCRKPTKPFKPYSLSDQWQVDSYNRDVDRYNSDLREYVRCMKDYLDNASNDIDRIKEKMQEAVDAAKRPY